MNKAVEKIIQENKRDFLVRNNLFEKEYATYTISGVGITENNEEIPFSFETNNNYTIGDELTLKQQDGTIVKTHIKNCRYINNGNFDEDEYPEQDCNNARRYKEVPLNITDEEYELLKKELSGTRDNIRAHIDEDEPDTPKTSIALYIIAGILFLTSFILFVMGLDTYDGTPLHIISAILSIVQGILFIAIGKIVNYLSIIASK